MTRKDFELIAETLAMTRPEPHWDANKRMQFDMTVRAFCATLTAHNARFDRDRFIKASGGLFFGEEV